MIVGYKKMMQISKFYFSIYFSGYKKIPFYSICKLQFGTRTFFLSCIICVLYVRFIQSYFSTFEHTIQEKWGEESDASEWT